MQESARRESRGSANLRIESLSFAEIPSQSRLFLDHLSNPEKLEHFYPTPARTTRELSEFASEVLSKYPDHRSAVCDVLAEQNISFGGFGKALANVEKLRRKDTVAVLTGQQIGILGGPLYTIYKAISAIRQAEELTASGIPAVPIFWAATEDHDLAEISAAFDMNADGGLSELKFAPDPKDESKPVGRIEVPDNASELIAAHFDFLPKTEFSSDVRDLIDDCWKPGRNYGEAFCRFIAAMFSEYGLIMVDPLDSRLKALAAPIFRQAIENRDKIAASHFARGKQLENEGYHSQVLVDDGHFPAFYITDEGRRRAIKVDGAESFRITGERSSFTKYELAAADPERFSAGVLLRPVVQDYLFPTVCYFGGGAEVAYFAQIAETYRVLDRPVTPIIHRQSFTVLEPNRRRVLDKFELRLSDLFSGFDALLPGVIDRFVDPGNARLFADAEENISAELHNLDVGLSRIDPTLAANLATRRQKILYHIGALQKKFHRVQGERNEIVGRQLRAAVTELFPRDGLQERTLTVVTFLNRHGRYFIDWLYAAVDLTERGHRIIKL
jgi:bacillithiol biosynthesis cysteine-adding enzyme BshC